MAMIMIKCPNTGQAVPTGIDMDQGSFDSSTLTGNSSQCSACGEMHTWSKGDAFLDPDTPFGTF